MALTSSTMLPLGTDAPPFELTDTVSGKKMDLSSIRGNVATVIMFICNHCPYVKHIQQELPKLANAYNNRGVAFIAISSNDAMHYPDDAPDKMREIALEFHYPFPYLYDESQEVARAYQAACTPDFYIFDNDMRCVYRGQLDGARPGNNVPVTGKDIRAGLDNLLAGKPISTDQTPSMGCNIKWK